MRSSLIEIELSGASAPVEFAKKTDNATVAANNPVVLTGAKSPIPSPIMLNFTTTTEAGTVTFLSEYGSSIYREDMAIASGGTTVKSVYAVTNVISIIPNVALKNVECVTAYNVLNGCVLIPLNNESMSGIQVQASGNGADTFGIYAYNCQYMQLPKWIGASITQASFIPIDLEDGEAIQSEAKKETVSTYFPGAYTFLYVYRTVPTTTGKITVSVQQISAPSF